MNPFATLMAALALELGLPELALTDEDSACLVAVDDVEVSLSYLPGADQIMMFAAVAPLPESGREALYARLLDANTFFHETQGFTLAARPDTGVTLQCAPHLRLLDARTIGALTRNFVNIAEHWRRICLEAPAPEERLAKAEGPDSLCASAPGTVLLKI